MNSDRNSLVPHLKAYIQKMFQDIRWLYGRKTKECDRDCERLLSQLDRHGVKVCAISLPAVAKHFDQCLDRGLYQSPELFLTRSKSRMDVRPKFLGALFHAIFDNDGKLRFDASVDCIVAIRQVYMGLKKLEQPCSQEAINDEIHTFVGIESDARRPTLDWSRDWVDGAARKLSFRDASASRDGRGRFRKSASSALQKRLGDLHNVCDITLAMLGDFHSERPNELPKHGPGVVSNQSRDEYKYSLTNWPERLNTVFPYTFYALANEGLVQEGYNRLSTIEFDSRLICVPKTLKAPRLIAAEPTENQWIQQLVKTQLEQRIGETPIADSIDFSSQEKNQILAKEGSLSGDYVTVDLSSASDRLSLWTVERFFRNNNSLLERLHACRTAAVSLRTFDGFPSRITLRKFATMGSACIFPVQTVVYSLMAIACTVQGKVSIKSIREAATKVQVFGDDIVVPRSSLPLLREMLDYFQLKVNKDKTFEGENFRESCGVDAFRGHDVSPVYAKHISYDKASFGSLSKFVALSNNLWKKGYWNMGQLVREWSDEWNRLVPLRRVTEGDWGYLTFSSLRDYVPHHKERWNKVLQRREYRIAREQREIRTTQVNSHATLLALLIKAERRDAERRRTDSFVCSPFVPNSFFSLPLTKGTDEGIRKHGPVLVQVGWTTLYYGD